MAVVMLTLGFCEFEAKKEKIKAPLYISRKMPGIELQNFDCVRAKLFRFSLRIYENFLHPFQRKPESANIKCIFAISWLSRVGISQTQVCAKERLVLTTYGIEGG